MSKKSTTSDYSEMGRIFTFKAWQFNASNGELELNYTNHEFGDFVEKFTFPTANKNRYLKFNNQINKAIDCLHWMAGVSYYKTTLAKEIQFTERKPNQLQADWLSQTWQHGLAELAFENQLPWLDHIRFSTEEVQNNGQNLAANMDLSARSLVAIGGGKDSLVSIEAIKAMDETACLFMVGQSEFIQAVAVETDLPLVQVKRQVDPKLAQINDQGAFNGHVPITAINACVAVVAALLFDFDSVVFSNERSADSGNVKLDNGQWVNHQYSKSLAYEKTWQQIIHQDLAQDLHCFSLLRPYSELAIIKKFSKLNQYFPHFSSCNRNFHLAGSQNQTHHWCGQCPKCAFVFLCLAPFISQDELLKIFNKNLFEDTQLIALFEALLGIQGIKPFECVGEQQECRLALHLLKEHQDWQSQPQVKRWLQVLPAMDQQHIKQIMAADPAHLIPQKRQFRQLLVS